MAGPGLTLRLLVLLAGAVGLITFDVKLLSPFAIVLLVFWAVGVVVVAVVLLAVINGPIFLIA